MCSLPQADDVRIFVLNMDSDFAREVICNVRPVKKHPHDSSFRLSFRQGAWPTILAMCGSHMAGIQDSGGRMARLNAVEKN